MAGSSLIGADLLGRSFALKGKLPKRAGDDDDGSFSLRLTGFEWVDPNALTGEGPAPAAGASPESSQDSRAQELKSLNSDPGPHSIESDNSAILRIFIDADGNSATTDDVAVLEFAWSYLGSSPFARTNPKDADLAGGDWAVWQKWVTDHPDHIANLTQVSDWIDAFAPLGDLGFDENSVVISWGIEPAAAAAPATEFFG